MKVESLPAAYYHGDRTVRIGECILQSPGPEEVRINVSTCGVCGTDLHIFQGHMDQRLVMPQIIGHEMSGWVAEVGSDVGSWKVGDRVVVRPLDPCLKCPACLAGHRHICHHLKFLGIDTPGAFQASWTVPAHSLHPLPSSVSMEKAALIEPLAVACHDVRLGRVQPGDYVIVIGGGPIGLLAALVASGAGARVLISEVNPFRVNLAANLGLEALNPQDTDLVAAVEKATDGAGADVVFEVSGSADGALVMTQLVRTRGRIVVVAIHADPPRVDLFRFFWREIELCGVRVYEAQDFEKAIRLVESSELPFDQLITHRSPLSELSSVLKQMESGAEIMKVLIRIQGE